MPASGAKSLTWSAGCYRKAAELFGLATGQFADHLIDAITNQPPGIAIG